MGAFVGTVGTLVGVFVMDGSTDEVGTPLGGVMVGVEDGTHDGLADGDAVVVGSAVGRGVFMAPVPPPAMGSKKSWIVT